jgi:hypothetical protein
LGDLVKEDEMGRARSTHLTDKKCVKNFGRKPEGKTPVGRRRSRREDNIRIYVMEMDWTGFIWLRIGTNGGLL